MTEKEMSEVLIDFYLAIYEDNLEKTKEIVALFNNLTFTSDMLHFFDLNNPLRVFQTYYINNTSYEYVIYNLQHIDNIELYQWNYLITTLNISKNITQIEDLINNILIEDKKISNFFKIDFSQIKLDLIKLSILIQNFILLEKIKNKQDWSFNI